MFYLCHFSAHEFEDLLLQQLVAGGSVAQLAIVATAKGEYATVLEKLSYLQTFHNFKLRALFLTCVMQAVWSWPQETWVTTRRRRGRICKRDIAIKVINS